MKSLLAALLLFSCQGIARALTLYSVTDLGDYPGGAEHSQAHAINGAGQVVGVGQNSSLNRAFLSSVDGTGMAVLTDLGSLPSLASTRAHDINARGQIVGGSSDGDKTRAFLWSPVSPNSTTGSMLEVQGMPGERNHSTAIGINARGQIVGTSSGRGYLWSPGTANGTTGNAVDLGGLPNGTGGCLAFAINDSGQVVGIAGSATGDHAFLWRPTVANGNSGTMIDLGNLPGGNGPSQASAINNAGAVTGHSVTATGQHAFIWIPDGVGSGTMTDLGDLEGGNDLSFGYGINAANKVVGNSNASDSDHAFLWTGADGMLDLNSLTDASGAKWTLRFAQDINNTGQIAGWGTFDPDGPGGIDEGTYAFRLEPIAEIASGQVLARREGSQIAFYFVGIAGATYQLQNSARPAGPWADDGEPFVSSGAINSLRRPLDGERGFWRIVDVATAAVTAPSARR